MVKLEILVFLLLLSVDASHCSRERLFAYIRNRQIWISLSVLSGKSILLQGKNYPASDSSSLVWNWQWSLLGVRKTCSLLCLKCCELLGLFHWYWLSCLLFGQVLPCSTASPSEHLENCLSNRVKIINESYITVSAHFYVAFLDYSNCNHESLQLGMKYLEQHLCFLIGKIYFALVMKRNIRKVM